MNRQSMFDTEYRMLGAGARGWSREMTWDGRWEGGSGLRTYVHPWQIHVNVWQNQYIIVKQNKVKIKIKKKKSMERCHWRQLPTLSLGQWWLNGPKHCCSPLITPIQLANNLTGISCMTIASCNLNLKVTQYVRHLLILYKCKINIFQTVL